MRTRNVGNTYIFTIPALSEVPTCTNGTIMAIQYCYEDRLQDSVRIFDLLMLNRSGERGFNVISSLSVQSPQTRSDICTVTNSNRGRSVCCDIFNISPSDQIKLPPSGLTYGVVNRNGDNRPLAFRDDVMEYQVQQFSANPRNSNLNPGRSFDGDQENDRSLLLLRFLIGM